MEKKLPGILQSILDIPLALKGFPKNLTRQPKNKEEMALYKREHAAYMWCGVAILALCVVLIAIGTTIDNFDTMMTFTSSAMIVGLVGGGFIIFLLYRMNGIKNGAAVQIEDLTCPACGEMIEFDENVSFEVLGKSWRTHSGERPMKDNHNQETGSYIVYAHGEENTKVQITCRCQKCGKDHTFEKLFTTGKCSKEMRDVSFIQKSDVRLQLDNQVRQVCADVFDEGKPDKNAYGVMVSVWSVASCVKEHFDV